MLEVRNLHASIAGKEILKGINLTIPDGETHAIMGPNGSGKSTLSAVLTGNPLYEVTEGEAWFNGKNLLEMKPEDRAHEGLFLSFQYPVEIPGVSMTNFMKAAVNEKRKYQGLERQEKPLVSTVFRLHLQQVLTIEISLTLSHFVERITYKHSRQRRLARTVRSHDGMRLSVIDDKVYAFQYLFVAYLGM